MTPSLTTSSFTRKSGPFNRLGGSILVADKDIGCSNTCAFPSTEPPQSNKPETHSIVDIWKILSGRHGFVSAKTFILICPFLQ